MSRAFVKEPDGDQPEALPERRLSGAPNRMTAAGIARPHLELQTLRARLAALTVTAAVIERALLERDIAWLQSRLASAIPVSAPADCSRVAFGASVQLVGEDGTPQRYRIVGEDEADPANRLIAWTSPLARAFEGARTGDIVIWPRPAGDLEVEILAIDFTDSKHEG